MSLQSWYRRPEQELTRREVRWVKKWLFRGPGLKWVVLFTLLYLTWYILAPNVLLVAMPGFGLLALIKVMVWYDILTRRTFRPLSGQMIRDLAITPFGHALVWPGLIAAPVTACAIFGAIDFLCRIIGSITPSPFDWFFAQGWNSMPAQPGSDIATLRLLTSASGIFVTGVFGLAMSVLWWMAITAFITRMAMPEGGVIRIAFFLFIGSMIIGLPSLAVSLPLRILNQFSFSEPILMMAMITIPWIVSFVAAYLLYFYSLNALRSAAAWKILSDKIRRDS